MNDLVPYLDKLPPRNLEAEAGAIGSAYLDAEAADEVAAALRPDDFHLPAHETIWAASLRLRDRGHPLDPLLLIDELTRTGHLDEVGGHQGVVDLLNGVPHAAHASYYAGIVRQKAISRRLIDVANRMLRDGYSHQYTADELLDRAARDLFAVEARALGGAALATLEDAARDSLRRFDLRMAGQETGLRTGFVALDDILGGLRPDMLVILAARPSMGKTALAMDIIQNVARREHRVLFLSLEMGLSDLGDRAVCAEAGVDSSDYRLPLTANIDRRALVAAVEKLGDLPVSIEVTPSLTPRQIQATARRAARRGPLGLIVVDYLQIVGGDGADDGEYERVGRASMALKALAKEHQCPVLALSQLSRECEKREDKRPKLSDLRASGQIEQDADVVLFLYRAEYYQPGDSPGVAELAVAKNRSGPLGTAFLGWNAARTTFHDRQDAGPAVDAAINFDPPPPLGRYGV